MKPLSHKYELFLTFILASFCIYYLSTTLISIWSFTTDDAYISWVYARQLVEGQGLQWHANLPRVEGYSNFLWIIIAALVLKLKLPVVITMKILSCVSLGAGLFFLYRLGRLFFSPLLAILPVFIFSHYLGVIWWTVSGMESMFYCALALLFVWQAMAAVGYRAVHGVQTSNKLAVSNGAWIVTNIVLLLLGLTRFEGIVWSVPLSLFVLCQFRGDGLKTRLKESKILPLWPVITACCLLLPYAIYFIWRVAYFGSWIPNSYLCKALASGYALAIDFDYVFILMPLLVASLPYFLFARDCRHWLLWLPSLLYLVMLWDANPVIAHFLRLFLGPFALFSLLPVLGVRQALSGMKPYQLDPKLWVTSIILLITFLFIPGNESKYLHALLNQYKQRTQIRLEVADLLNTQSKPRASVLFGDCGIVPFSVRSDIRFVDSDCLNNKQLTSAPYKQNLALYAEYVKNQLKPDWVITTYEPVEMQGNYLFELLRQKEFFRDYQLITTLKSGWSYDGADRRIDYVYSVYKRRD